MYLTEMLMCYSVTKLPGKTYLKAPERTWVIFVEAEQAEHRAITF